jgi:predicted phosphoribosyltransferase
LLNKYVFAYYLAAKLGGNVLEDSVYYDESDNKRKEMTQWERMVSHRAVGIFDKEELKDKNVVLVDDQYTTGGTIRDTYVVLREEGIKVTSIICLGASRERDFLCDKASIAEIKDRFTSQELSKIRSLTSDHLYDMTQSEVNLILKTNKENVLPKLEQAYSSIHEKTESRDQSTIIESQHGYKIKNDEITQIS